MDFGRIKTHLKWLFSVLLLFATVVLPDGGFIYKTETGYISFSTHSLYTYKEDLSISSYRMLKPQFSIGNYTFSISDAPSSFYKAHLYGDTLVIFSPITDTAEVYIYDNTCVKFIKQMTIPTLKDIVVKDNTLIAITSLGDITLDIPVSGTDTLSEFTINATPTIDNIALFPEKPILITQSSATYTYKGIPLHTGDDLYITQYHMWLTHDHIHYLVVGTSTTFQSSDAITFIGEHPITATISKLWGPILKIHTYKDTKWHSKTHRLIFDDWGMASKAKKAVNISLGQSDDKLFVAFATEKQTIFFIYTVKQDSLSFESVKVFPGIFVIKGSYALYPATGYIMKLGTWGSPIPPSPNFVSILKNIPYILSDQYLNSLHIRWCRDE